MGREIFFFLATDIRITFVKLKLLNDFDKYCERIMFPNLFSSIIFSKKFLELFEYDFLNQYIAFQEINDEIHEAFLIFSTRLYSK